MAGTGERCGASVVERKISMFSQNERSKSIKRWKCFDPSPLVIHHDLLVRHIFVVSSSCESHKSLNVSAV